MKTYNCPNCGVKIKLVFSDPEAERIHEKLPALLASPEELDPDDQKNLKNGLYSTPLCPSCNSLVVHCSEWPTPSIADLLGRTFEYEYVVAEE